MRNLSFQHQQLLACELVSVSFLIGLEGEKFYLMPNEPRIQNSFRAVMSIDLTSQHCVLLRGRSYCLIGGITGHGAPSKRSSRDRVNQTLSVGAVLIRMLRSLYEEGFRD